MQDLEEVENTIAVADSKPNVTVAMAHVELNRVAIASLV